jgi:hypothetical protein
MLKVLDCLNEEVIVWNTVARHKLLGVFNYPVTVSSDSKPLVENKYHSVVSVTDSISIMRPSKWGNPYSMCDVDVPDKDTQREIVVALHLLTLLCNPHAILECNKSLHRKRLLCCCYPKLCHGNILVLLANNPLYFVRGVKNLCDYIVGQQSSGNPIISNSVSNSIFATYNYIKPIIVPKLQLVNS